MFYHLSPTTFSFRFQREASLKGNGGHCRHDEIQAQTGQVHPPQHLQDHSSVESLLIKSWGKKQNK